MSERIETVTLWVCDECGYYRAEKTTGKHQTTNPANPNGPLVAHELKPVQFARREARDG